MEVQDVCDKSSMCPGEVMLQQAAARGLEQQGLCQLHCSVSPAAALGAPCRSVLHTNHRGHGRTSADPTARLEITSIRICKILKGSPLKYCKHTFQKVCVCFLVPDPVGPDAGIPHTLQIRLVKTTASDQFPGQPDELGEPCWL